ncbi:MAG: bifunctional demethylmenaquinone methyltransferase/2-methoxy-6-polyprenyl-1,4-benzoquinol methylase UbiE [Desulfobacterales bacterium]|nr:bifunctional demethylmenaquinone methyltransferase/2-methoxy-6-polyprenyl-1,4-benzoquinol methylase UbiE [Desulfobacterales bacterium]
MDIHSQKQTSYKIFDNIAKTYDFLNHLLSFGFDFYWRKQLLKLIPIKKGQYALDIATGTGDIPILLSQKQEIVSITGIDLSKEMITLGNKKIIKKGLENKVKLIIGDGVILPFPDQSFDVVTIGFGIRNFYDMKNSLKNIHRVLKKDGRLLIIEFSIPQNKIIKQMYLLYFRHILPSIGNLISKHNNAYSYLNATVEDFPYGKDFAKLMSEAGFKNIRFKMLTFGVVTIYVGEKREN